MPLSKMVLVGAMMASVAYADDTPQEIIKRAKERGGLNLVGLTAEIKLVTTLADGRSKEQQLSSSAKKVDGHTRAVARFSAPAGVAGVAVLTVEGQRGGGDEVSLYLPKLKRVRQVAQADRGKAFMDTDFAYADLVSSGTDDSAVTQLADSTVDGRACWVLKGPGGADSPYGAVTFSIDKQTSVPLQIDYADKSGQPFKRYRAIKLKTFKSRVLAAEATMETIASRSKTTLTILKLDEVTGADDEYSERALERGP